MTCSGRRGKKEASTATNPELEAEVHHIREHLVASTGNSIREEIAAGRRIAALRDIAKYGDGAIRKAAEKLGVSSKLLHRLALRAERFTDDEINAALEDAARSGYVLSASMLDELAKVDNPDRRSQLLSDCIDKKWTVRRCRNEIGQHDTVGPAGSRSNPIVRQLERAKILGEFLRGIQLGALQSDVRTELLQQLEGLYAAISELKKQGTGPQEQSVRKNGPSAPTQPSLRAPAKRSMLNRILG